MLDKLQRAVITALIRGGFTCQSSKFDSIQASLMPLLHGGETFETLSMCIEDLIRQGYVAGEPFYMGCYPVPEYRNLHTTYKGLHRRYFALRELARAAVRSFLCPIAAAVITTLITNWLIAVLG